jgi:hypothetical protein
MFTAAPRRVERADRADRSWQSRATSRIFVYVRNFRDATATRGGRVSRHGNYSGRVKISCWVAEAWARDQIRNLYTLAEVYHRYGPETAEAFSTEAAATLRKIVGEPVGTRAEVQQAIDWHNTREVAGSLTRIVQEPRAEWALETACRAAARVADACQLSGRALVSRCRDAGIDLDRIWAAMRGERTDTAPANEPGGPAAAATDGAGMPEGDAADRAGDAGTRGHRRTNLKPAPLVEGKMPRGRRHGEGIRPVIRPGGRPGNARRARVSLMSSTIGAS